MEKRIKELEELLEIEKQKLEGNAKEKEQEL